MATISQTLTARLELDQTRFQTGLNRSVKSAESTGEKMKRGFKRAGVAVVALTAAVVALGIKLLNAGARAVATRSRFETVFGASTAKVEAFNKEFGKISGLSQQAFEETIATTAAIAQGMGFAQAASAEFAIEITKVAGDLASFNGLRTEEVALAVNSALTGEREAMKRLGIVILETDVQQKAFEITGKTVAKTLTQQEKATATLALITDRAGVAMGDLSRTASDTDNVIKQLVAAWIDLVDTVGKFIANSPAVRDFLIQIRDIMQSTIVVLDAGGPAVADAAKQVGLIIGNAMAVGILEALETTLQFNISKLPIIGKLFSTLNIAAAAAGAGADVARDNLKDLGIVLNDIVADAEAATAALAAIGTDGPTAGGAPPTAPTPTGGSGDFITGPTVTQRQLEALRQAGQLGDAFTQSLTNAGIVAAGLPPLLGQANQQMELLGVKTLVVDERTGQIVEQTQAQIAAVARWREGVQEVALVLGNETVNAMQDLLTGASSVIGAIKNLGASIIKLVVGALKKAVAEAIALKIVLAATGPSGFLKNVPLIGGLFRHGGMIPSAANGINLTPGVVNGLARTRGDGIPIIAHPGEAVITRNAVESLGGPKAIDAINSRSRNDASAGTGGTTNNTFTLSFPGVRDMLALKRELPGILRDLDRKGAI